MPPELQGEDLSFTGHPLPPDVARGIAAGDLDPATHLPFDAAPPDPPPVNAAGAVEAPLAGAGRASPAALLPPQGASGRQATITSLFGRRPVGGAADRAAPPLSTAPPAGLLPPVSANASRDVRPPRPAGGADAGDRACASGGASPPAAGPDCDDAPGDGSTAEAAAAAGSERPSGPQAAVLKRGRGWTANPFVPAAKRLSAAAALAAEAGLLRDSRWAAE